MHPPPVHATCFRTLLATGGSALALAVALVLPQHAAAWDATAGAIPPHTDGATFTATSNADDLERAYDGDSDTFWQSGSCLPTGFVERADLNLALGACAAGLCDGSDGADALELATDADVYTGYAADPDATDTAWFDLTLPSTRSIERVSIKGALSEPVDIWVTTPAGEVLLGSYTVEDAYDYVAFDGPAATVSAVHLRSAAGFTVTELAVQGDDCFEQVTMDLGAPVEIGLVLSRHMAGGDVLSTTLLTSGDGETWSEIATLVSDTTPAVTTRIDPPVTARYLALRHDTVEEDYVKVYLWEIDAWDANGIYGARPTPAPGPTTLATLSGVNGIWGWGTDGYSVAGDPNRGPSLYARAASQGRNYHNLHWDVVDPDTVPDFEAMADGAGTDAQPWLDWDLEYQAWRDAGLSVQTSIQFIPDFHPESMWDDPYGAAYAYGEAFARHFGPTSGNGLVDALEVGNETFYYTADFYKEVLAGMAAGAKAGDPAIEVMPSAMSATGLIVEDEDGGWDLGTRVTEEHAPYIDSINTHIYSFWYTPEGARKMVRPEHPDTMFQEVQNVLAWRNANMPDAPVHVTEWGWASDGGGETCSGDECVSENAQALYTVRGLMMLARWGVERSHWFFFANLTSGDSLFDRCGLTGSSEADFAPKQSMHALERVLETLGDRTFVDVLQEDEDAYVYLFGDPGGGDPTHAVAWLPADADGGETGEVLLPLTAAPTAAWTLSGLEAEGETAPLPEAAEGGWRLSISPVPVALALAEGSVPDDTGDPDDTGGDDPSGDGGDGGDGEDGEDDEDTGNAAPAAYDDAPGGCGCSGGSPNAAAAWPLLLILLVRRRRPAPNGDHPPTSARRSR